MTRTLLLRLVLGAVLAASAASAASAQSIFDAGEFSSSRAAIAALGDIGTALGIDGRPLDETLARTGARRAGAPYGSVLGRQVPTETVATALAGDRVADLARRTIAHARSRPDNRPLIEQFMEQAGVSYGDVPAPNLRGGGSAGVKDYHLRLLEHVSAQLRLQNARGAGSQPDPRLQRMIAALRSNLAATKGVRTPPVDPSDAPPGAGLTQPDPDRAARTRPDPNDLPAVIDRVLESNGCTASEKAIHDAITQRTDTWTANQAIRFWTESSSFSDGYASRVRNGDTVYTMTTGPVCDRRPAEDAAGLSGAARWLIDQAVAYECQGRPGRMDGSGVTIRDLDGDGSRDLILDHSGISCDGTAPLSCGAQVCESHVYLRRGALLEEALAVQGTILAVTDGMPPGIEVWGHGGTTAEYAWTGAGFARR